MIRLAAKLFLPSFFLLFLSFLSFIPIAAGRDIPKGQMIFESRCASCHGLNAKGSFPMAKTLKVDPRLLDLTRIRVVHRSDSELQNLISNGHYKMPKHKEVLTPQQVQSVVKYLRSLQTSVALKAK
jgi:mono/diheme cytochrome c family protein